jgi:hypothetical protein
VLLCLDNAEPNGVHSASSVVGAGVNCFRHSVHRGRFAVGRGVTDRRRSGERRAARLRGGWITKAPRRPPWAA